MTQFSRMVARRWASLVFGAALTLPAMTWSQVVEVHPQNPPEAINTAPQAMDETSPVWFVELSSLPAAEGTDTTALRTEQGAFRTAAVQARIPFKERFAFNTLWNGLSIAASARAAAELKQLPGVTAVYPVALVQRPEPGAGLSPELATAVAMTGADLARSELGYTGAGVKVGVIDTGIDIDHSDLGGTGVNGLTPFPSTRVVAGYDFVGDAFNADPDSPGYNPVPVPDPNPDDCAGHGTHVAGIIGADGIIQGVAPGVKFGAYRVFGCDGSTTADIILAAMEQALRDRMDVVNMSLGAAFQWPQYPTAQASDRLVNRGIVVVASAGNQGASGLYSAGAPGVGKKVISVASFDNTEVTLNVARVSPDDAPIGITPAVGAPLPPTSGTFLLARTGTQTTTDDACAALPEGSLAGKIALIRRGTCAFYTKALNAQNAGAIAVILYNNVPGRINPTVAGDPAITIPVVAISDEEGVMLDNRLAAGAVDITWTDELAKFPNPATGGLISSFSAYGLAPDLSLKPDIGAPGGFIFSTYPLEQGGYADLSGTSMSAPHVAGAVALLLEARPHTPAQAVRGILQNSADPQPWWGAPALGFLDNVHRQGAGMLDIDDAILATTRIEPAKLELGESQSGPDTRLLWIENRSRKRVTYTLSYENALSTGPGTYTPSFFLSDATVSFKSPTVTLKPGSLGWVVATITPPTGPDQGQYGGYIVLTPNDGGQVYRVPFAGFIGDYQSIPVLTPTPYEFPWLSLLYGGSFYYISGPDDWVYSMVGEDIPFFLIHLDHYARKLRLDLLDPVTGRLLGSASQDEYLPRNSSATGFFAFPWDGTLKVGRRTKAAPDGQYVMRLSVLKALGSEWNPADWETWTSPVIQIDRP